VLGDSRLAKPPIAASAAIQQQRLLLQKDTPQWQPSELPLQSMRVAR
jgi:hypothetical protein